jgi:ubiquitin-conjugating enzyme E2 J1
MAATAAYNVHNPAVKRILREVRDFQDHESSDCFAAPLDDNIFEWHFTVRGPADTDFEGGIYHGRIILPPEYPMKPPNIVLLTPNGRFEVGTKICLSVSAHHPEEWKPSWGIRTILIALVGFMPSPGSGAIGALDLPPEERKKLALQSHTWKCARCGDITLPSPSPSAPPITSLASSFEQSPLISSTEGKVTVIPVTPLDASGDVPPHNSHSSSLESDSLKLSESDNLKGKEEETEEGEENGSQLSDQNSASSFSSPHPPSLDPKRDTFMYSEGLHQRHVHHDHNVPPQHLPHPQQYPISANPSPHPQRHPQSKTIGMLDLFMVIIVFAIMAILVRKYVTMNH